MKRPYTCTVDTTERCNLKCTMCYFSAVDRVRFPPFDRETAPDGFMPVELFERIAADCFPRAAHVALACACEPLIHPEFRRLLAIAARYEVPDLWFPTNLLPLTEGLAEAMVEARVRTVAVSIDGVTADTYDAIRVGGSFDRLLSRLKLLRQVKAQRRSRHPRVRIIFTWMRSNRADLQAIPAFAAEHGAEELDVRFVSPTVGVDLEAELLTREPVEALKAELDAALGEAVSLGIRLHDYPQLAVSTRSRRDAFRRQWTRWRTGTNTMERFRLVGHAWLHGCCYAGHYWVIRPHGAVLPCIYWQEQPIGFYPEENVDTILAGERLTAIRDGLARGRRVGSCVDCEVRRAGFYRPLY